MTNEFYKGMLHAVKSAKDYAEVVKKNYESNIDRVVPLESCSYSAGGAAGMRKMLEYFDIFIDFLKGYDDDDKRNESN